MLERGEKEPSLQEERPILINFIWQFPITLQIELERWSRTT